MKSHLRIIATTICLLSWNLALSANGSQQTETIEEDETDETQVIWIGPGWYGGVWFDNEDDFNDWHRHYHHDDDYHHGDQRDRGDHGEGGRGGGHGGGGGHR